MRWKGEVMFTFIVVLYKETPKNSITIRSLEDSLKKINLQTMISIIIYDNSPISSETEIQYLNFPKNIKVLYQHDPSNKGIATAYNYGFEYAQKHQDTWLCLLDQDTVITEKYLEEVFPIIEKNDCVCDAIIPQIKDEESIISPIFTDKKGIVPLSGKYSAANIMGINSGAILKIKFLEEIGGFNLEFPLDYLDHWLFFMLNKLEKTILVINCVLEHDLSVKHLKSVGNNRYYNILFYEKKFIKKYQPQKMIGYYGHSVVRMLKCIMISPSKVPLIIKMLFKSV